MKKPIKSQTAIICVIIMLITIPLVAIAADFTVSATVFPKAGLSFNFDALSFEGEVGATDIAGTATLAGTNVGLPVYTVRYKDAYNVRVSGTDFTDGEATPKTLQIERLNIIVTSTDAIPVPIYDASVTTSTTLIDSTSGAGASTKSLDRNVSFMLDLIDTGITYGDEGSLASFDSDVSLNSTLTLSFDVL